jgi:hypothetical protein
MSQGEIIEYQVPDDNTDPALTTQDTYPMIVVASNDDGTVSGLVFLTDGSTRYVHVRPETEEEKAEASEIDNLRAENERLRAAQNDTPPTPPQEPQNTDTGAHSGDSLNIGSDQ